MVRSIDIAAIEYTTLYSWQNPNKNQENDKKTIRRTKITRKKRKRKSVPFNVDLFCSFSFPLYMHSAVMLTLPKVKDTHTWIMMYVSAFDGFSIRISFKKTLLFHSHQAVSLLSITFLFLQFGHLLFPGHYLSGFNCWFKSLLWLRKMHLIQFPFIK